MPPENYIGLNSRGENTTKIFSFSIYVTHKNFVKFQNYTDSTLKGWQDHGDGAVQHAVLRMRCHKSFVIHGVEINGFESTYFVNWRNHSPLTIPTSLA